jgi:hypothetical protein
MNMKVRTALIPLLLVVLLCGVGATAQAHTMPHELRSGVTVVSSSKLAPAFTNAAGDITIAAPVGWGIDQSETWSKSADGTEDYTESVNLNAANNASISISASDAGDDTLASKMKDLKSTYDSYTILSEGTTTLGMDVGYYIEAQDSYNHVREMVVIKNGWEYDLYSYADPKKWKKYNSAIISSFATARFTAVK